MKKVKIEKTNRLLDDFFKVDEAYLQFEKFDGTMSPSVRRLNFERGDGVAALVFNEDTDRIILIRQFRYAAYTKNEGWVIETVAGMLADGEKPEEAITREIEEEVGYKNAALTHIHTFFVSPGGSSERIFLYYAVVNNENKIHEGGGLGSEEEDIQVLEYHFEELQELMAAEMIMDAKTLIAL
ncbi:MAG TPA: NUDIX hydrolase, partial [Phaeodactylibacter sp.]|nr:NUDIX hydrolase [Phaeodactylibacter sp.]